MVKKHNMPQSALPPSHIQLFICEDQNDYGIAKIALRHFL